MRGATAPERGRCVICSAIRVLLLVAVACCIGRLVRLARDAVLNADELRGVSPAFGADEDVAHMIVVATNLQPMTDGADHSRISHGNIFARHDHRGLWGARLASARLLDVGLDGDQRDSSSNRAGRRQARADAEPTSAERSTHTAQAARDRPYYGARTRRVRAPPGVHVCRR